jgi:hypothetical protein
MTQVKLAETTIFAAMDSVSQGKVNNVLGQIRRAIPERKAYELETRTDGLSKDFENVAALDDATFARFCAAVGINPGAYINSPAMTPEDFEKRSGIPAEAKTGNQKGYKKTLEAAHYFAHGSRLENVLKTFVACSILAAQYHLVIPRDVCERFLNSIPLNHVSEELAETLDKYRAKHMTGGAPTQTSQCTLQLATMRAAQVIRNGRRKDFALDLDSIVTESFAQRFGLMPQLEKARKNRAEMLAAGVE